MFKRITNYLFLVFLIVVTSCTKSDLRHEFDLVGLEQLVKSLKPFGGGEGFLIYGGYLVEDYPPESKIKLIEQKLSKAGYNERLRKEGQYRPWIPVKDEVNEETVCMLETMNTAFSREKQLGIIYHVSYISKKVEKCDFNFSEKIPIGNITFLIQTTHNVPEEIVKWDGWMAFGVAPEQLEQELADGLAISE